VSGVSPEVPELSTHRRLAVVSAGLSQPSSTRLLADRLTQAVVRRLQDEGVDVATDVIELRGRQRRDKHGGRPRRADRAGGRRTRHPGA